MSFGNVSFYTFQGSNCTFCNSTASTTPIQTVIPAIPGSSPAALLRAPILLLPGCSQLRAAFDICPHWTAMPLCRSSRSFWVNSQGAVFSVELAEDSQLWKMPFPAAWQQTPSATPAGADGIHKAWAATLIFTLPVNWLEMDLSSTIWRA